MIKDIFNRFMNKLRLAITIIVALFIGASIYALMDISRIDIIDIIIALIFICILSMIMYLIIYYWYGKDYKCPSCKKRFCIKKTGEEEVKRESVSVLVETNTKNRNGEIVGYQEQYVPGTRITYRINKICKKCGKKCYNTYSVDKPNL
jgi:hypothetical protein